MKNNKVFALTLILIILVIGVLGYYLYSMGTDKPISISVKNIIKGNDEDTPQEKEQTKKETKNETKDSKKEDTVRALQQVKDYKDFFNIDRVINEYYEAVTKSDGDKLLNIYDNGYIKLHKISKKNISNYYDTEFQDISFFSKEMYVKGKNDADYYFVKGETQKYNFIDEEITEGNNVYFMVIVDNFNSTYSIYPLSNISSTYTYASNYNIPSNKSITDNDSNTFIEKEYSDYTIAEYYVNYYRSILFLNTERAYNMTGTLAKAKYPELKDFSKDLENIYTNVLGAKLSGYNVTGEAGSRRYILNSGSEITVTITENSIMDIVVDF